MKSLSSRTARVARAVGEVMFDAGHGVDPDRMTWFMHDLDKFLDATGPKTRLALRFALLTIQMSPPFLIGRFSRFTQLSRPEQLRVLERYELSSLSLLFAATKTLLCMPYFEHPKTLMEAGLDPRLVWPGVESELGPLSSMAEAFGVSEVDGEPRQAVGGAR